MNNIVIIGAGIAGLSAAESIRKKDEKIRITLITDEGYLPYSRIKIGRYLNKDFDINTLYVHKPEWYSEMGVEVLLNKKISGIDTEGNLVYIEGGEKIGYSKLILANGSEGFIPPIEGRDKKGVFVVRKIKDVLNINKYMKDNNVKNITVIGGGLLGIEAAWTIKESGDYNVNIIETFPRILPRQLDVEGSRVLEDAMGKSHIKLYTGVQVKSLSGNENVESVILNNGDRVESELVIISAGVRSNIGIAKDGGININRGIIVDDNMKTNIDNVYSAGDAAEYKGNVWGIWPIAVEQGKIAGMNAVGISETYKEVTPSNLLQVMDINVFSAGTIQGKDLKELKYDNGLYSKLFFKEGVLTGIILIGDTKKGFAAKKAIEQKRDFTEELNSGESILQKL